ncbi:MAG: CHAP domain-containing protein [Myxococcota bacterium]|nr:CHAP domain-containing protein [Myxococcota bacterium]
MTPVLLAVLACAPVFRYPGPTRGVGKTASPTPTSTSGPWSGDPDQREAVAYYEAPKQAESGQGEQDEPKPRKPRRGRKGDGDKVAKAAGHYVGKKVMSCGGESFRYDCSGLVNVVHYKAGIDLRGLNSDGLWSMAQELGVDHKGLPETGDVVFFDNTYDRNGNGRLDDKLTHVAVVESVDDDGTVHLVHKGSKGVVRIVMNPEHPDQRLSPQGKEWNDWLRARKKGDSKSTQYFSGQLWVGSASFWAAPELQVGQAIAWE